METLPPEGVLARIVSAREGRDAHDVAVAFDGDGTLWSGDIGEDFFHATIARGRFEPVAVEAMLELAGTLGIKTDPTRGAVSAQQLFQGYLDQRVPEETICEVIAWACAGWSEEEVYAFAREVIREGKLEQRIHQELVPILAWARSEGIETLLVSASPRPVVTVAGALVGFAPGDVVAATAPFADGVMLPRVERPIPYGAGKAVLLERRLGARTLLAAFGDNVFDVPMLKAARVPVAVEPKSRLLAVPVEGLVRIAIRSPIPRPLP